METLVVLLRLGLAAVFATAGVAKLMDRTGSRRALEDFGVPERLARPGAVLLPLGELTIAIALVFPVTARLGALAAAALLGTFVVAIGYAMAQGRAPDCHCFGQLHSEPAGWSTLARNGVLIAMAALIVIYGPGPAVHRWIAGLTASELGLLAAGLALAGLAGYGLHRLRKWRKKRLYVAGILAQIEAIEKPSGLPVGSIAPPFELRSVRGEKVTLDALLARGKPVVLVFVHPRCGPCRELLPRLASWQPSLSANLTIAVLSESGVGVNRSLHEELGITDLMVQRHAEVYGAYGAQGTPSAVVIDTEGRIASAMVGGHLEVEELIRLTLRDKPGRTLVG